MSTKKKSPAVVKKSPEKVKSIKKTTPEKVVSKKAPAKKVVAKKTTPKKVTSKKAVAKKVTTKQKKTAVASLDHLITKDALKLVDKASDLLRTGIKTSHKATDKARASLHKEAHSLLSKATRHLDDALESGTSFLRKTINKI